MIIPENPHRGLLDDDGTTATVSDQLSTWTNLLRDLANYGSNLIPRAFTSSGKTLGDTILIGTLLRQLVAMIDAIEILLCRSAVHAATLPLRAMFEASVHIDWMLAGDRENKAAYYYVHNLLRLRTWAMRVQPGTAESASFKKIFDQAGLPVDNTLGKNGKKQVQEIDAVLSQARLVPVRDDFKKWKKLNGRTPEWYFPLGVTNIRDMAIKVNKEPFYELVYKPASEVMHGSNYGQHIQIQDGRVTFISIRHPRQFSHILRLTATIAIDIFRKILGEYRPEESGRAFSTKYVEKWRQAFMGIPELKINETELGA